jgi:hypothetical protein
MVPAIRDWQGREQIATLHPAEERFSLDLHAHPFPYVTLCYPSN